MTEDVTFKLARRCDAEPIAHMSRDLIEVGLGWSWRPARVTKQIRCPNTVVLIARARGCMTGFAIMHFRDEDAHLNLLAVKSSHQRTGIGRRLVKWLEESARVAGIATIHLEVRARNHSARAFYQSLGYREIVLVPRYYCGHESAIRMAHDLRVCD